MTQKLDGFIVLKAYARGSGKESNVWMDAAKVSSVCTAQDRTFVVVDGVTFATRLSVEEVLDLIAATVGAE